MAPVPPLAQHPGLRGRSHKLAGGAMKWDGSSSSLGTASRFKGKIPQARWWSYEMGWLQFLPWHSIQVYGEDPTSSLVEL